MSEKKGMMFPQKKAAMFLEKGRDVFWKRPQRFFEKEKAYRKPLCFLAGRI